MMQIPNSDAWLQHFAGRLQSDGFVSLPPERYQAAGFKYAARRRRFELAKFGMAETFFTFSDLPELNPQTMAAFSDAAFRFSLESKEGWLPSGVFESIWSFAVAITANLHPQVANWIRTTAPPKHFGAGEISAAFDTATGALFYFEGTPLWGAAYYAGFRKQLQTALGVAGPAR